ncbi:MAG: hypothetical protein K2H38_06665 [Muribaculaceae bacterium]|nr:hypothetical protein [Muribaculaceae bacterium]
MKEKDLDKCLDNLIIKGLIREAEQDNVEFGEALRNMSDEDFLALIYDSIEEPTEAGILHNKDFILANEEFNEMASEVSYSISDGFAGFGADERRVYSVPSEMDKPHPSSSGHKSRKLWPVIIASVAAVLLIVFIPVRSYLNSRLCQSALLASEAYMTNARGTDVASMPIEEVKERLPELEQNFEAFTETNDVPVLDEPSKVDGSEYYSQACTPEEAGMDLVRAYLRLGEKGKAVDVLRQLNETNSNPDFKEYCQKMLEILE